MANIGYTSVDSKRIVSITECPTGVKNTKADSISTILETTAITYVIKGTYRLDGSSYVHIESETILSEKDSKKSDYRPNKSDVGNIYINQDRIIQRIICPNGVVDRKTGTIITESIATVVETETKTYVICGVVHHEDTNKYIARPLSSIIAVNPRKKVLYRAI